jgi:predicted nucleic acid-binding protein
VIRHGERVFVDTGAWIALAVTADPYHRRAVEAWESLRERGARLTTSVPVVLETFTFLDRNTSRDVALAWKDSLKTLPWFRIVTGTNADLERSWEYFRRADLHKVSAVDATSFVLMSRCKARHVFAFDHHFAAVGFRLIG